MNKVKKRICIGGGAAVLLLTCLGVGNIRQKTSNILIYPQIENVKEDFVCQTLLRKQGDKIPRDVSVSKGGIKKIIKTGTKIKTETETEIQPEAGNQTETQPGSGNQTETETQSETGSQTETETQTETESQTETQSETESETQTESESKIIEVSNVRTAYPNNTRMFDDTNRVSLKADITGLPEGVELSLKGRAKRKGCGQWDVKVRCELTGRVKKDYRIKLESSHIRVRIIPRVLEVQIENAGKKYFSESTVEQLEFYSVHPIQIKGFVKNGEYTDEVPKGFVMPELELDSAVIQKESPMFENGIRKTYKGAIVLKRKEDGSVTGNTTENYCYSLHEEEGRYKKGDIRILAGRVFEGQDFTVSGEEEGTYYNEGTDFWISESKGIKVIPISNEKYNQTVILPNLKGDGSTEVILKKLDRAGSLIAASEPVTISWRVDKRVDYAGTLKVEGKDTAAVTNEKEGVIYFNHAVSVEADQFGDLDTGISHVSMRKLEGIESNKSMLRIREDYKRHRQLWTKNNCLTLTGEGSFRVIAAIEDRVGNIKFVQSSLICIDTKYPLLEIKGVQEKSTDNGPIQLRVNASDTNIRKGEMKIILTGERTGPRILEQKITYKKNQAFWSLDIPVRRQWDDRYSLQVSAVDLAGNRSVREVRFSVNRFGSVFQVDPLVKERLARFYFQSPFEIVMREQNVDKIKQCGLLVNHEGRIAYLKEDQDFQIIQKSQGKGLVEYIYRIRPWNFIEEGVYTVVLATEDEAGNKSDNRQQKKNIEFAIDRTAPDILVSGVAEQEIYQEASRTVRVEVSDNICMKEAQVYLDGVLIEPQTDSLFDFEVVQKEKFQRLQVRAEDEAGNVNETSLIFCVSGILGKGELEVKKEEGRKMAAQNPQTGKAGRGTDDGSEEMFHGAQKQSERFAESTRQEKQRKEREEKKKQGDGKGAFVLVLLAGLGLGGAFIYITGKCACNIKTRRGMGTSAYRENGDKPPAEGAADCALRNLGSHRRG